MSTISPRSALLAVTILAASAASLLPAHAASDRVRNACTSDYLRFCSQYDPDGYQTVSCMKKNAGRLSRACKTAVQEDGVPSGNKRVSSRNR